MTRDACKNRDLYLMYMRLENPAYSLFSRCELHKIMKKMPSKAEVPENVNRTQARIRLPPDERSSNASACCTQEHDGLAAIYLGIERGRLHLWENGSVIKWTCRKDGWPSSDDDSNNGLRVLIAVWYATQAWNEAMGGRVKFKYVSKLSDAAFEVRYETGGRKGLLARAFFPIHYNRDLNFLKIYRSSFDERYSRRYPLYNTFLHELGHILGLRHEFAHEKQNEMKAESIMFGINNSNSVMGYYAGQDIQPSDVIYIRKAYDELQHGSIVSALGPYGEVSKAVVRVRPDN